MQGRGDTMPCLFLLLHGDLYLVLDILYISIKNIKNFMQKYFIFLTRYVSNDDMVERIELSCWA